MSLAERAPYKEMAQKYKNDPGCLGDRLASDGTSIEIMLPTLSAGSISRILNGENMDGVVLQILDCMKILGTGKEQYSLLISDGVVSYPLAMLCTQLNSLVNQLQKFTIIRVDKCVCYQVKPHRKVIILLNLTVLTPGAEVKEKIGNPVN